MRRACRPFAVLLAAAVLASVAPVLASPASASPDAGSSPSTAPTAPAVKYAPTWKDERLADGGRRLTSFPGIAFRKDKVKGWVPASGEVVATADEEQPLAASESYKPIKFGSDPARLLEIGWDAGPLVLSAPWSAKVKPVKDDKDPKKVKYKAVDKGVDVDYEVGPDGVKELIVLGSATAPRSFKFHLSDPTGQLGEAQRTPDGGFRFSRPDAEGLSLTMPPAVAYEQPKGEELPDILAASATQTVVRAGDGFDITLAVDEQWLVGKSFPIVLDPTLNVTSPGGAGDCWLENGTHATTSMCGQSLVAGTNAGELGRTVVRFNLAEVEGKGGRVNAVTFGITQSGNTNKCTGTTNTACTQNLAIRAVAPGAGSSWNYNTTATWFRYRTDVDPDPATGKAPSWANVGISEGGGPDCCSDIATFSVPYNDTAVKTRTFSSSSFPALKSTVQGWVDRPASDHGFHIRGFEGTGTQFIKFYNRQGAIPASISVDYTPLPFAPTMVGPVTEGDTRITASLEPSSNAADAGVTGYTYSATDTVSNARFTAGPCGTTCTITGLTNGAKYMLSAIAHGSAGNSDPALDLGPYSPYGAPSAPTGVSVNVDRAPGEADVTWNASATNGRPISRYIARAYLAGTTTLVAERGCDSLCISNGRKVTFTALSNGTTYDFRVTAYTDTVDRNTSAESATVSGKPYAVPGVPTNVVADVTPAATEASLTWTVPSDNGRPIERYTLRAYTTSGGTLVPATGVRPNPCTAPPCSVTGLVNGTSYQFTAQAHNLRGPGPESAKSAAQTPYGLPGAPTNVSADVSAATNRATVSFTPPADNGGRAISSYTVRAYTGSGSTRQLVAGVSVSPSPCTASPCTVSGLVNGTAYVFTVAAVNVRGEGAQSAESAAVTPYGVPDAPTGVVADVSNAPGQATVSWTAPKDNGRPITSYTVRAYTGSGSTRQLVAGTTVTPQPCTASPCTVTGLSNGTAYVFTVSATNARGEGPQSAESAARTPYDRPGVPTDLVVTDGDRTATLKWAPPTNVNGSDITSYTVTLIDAAGLQVGPARKVLASDPRTVTFGELANGAKYTFTIFATNDRGNSDTVTAGPAQPSKIPNAPESVTATARTGEVTVTWTVPTSDGGSPLLDYTVTLHRSSDKSQVGLAQTFTDSTRPAVFTVTDNGVAYYASVTARNARGSSTPVLSRDVTPYAPVALVKAIVSQQPSYSPGDLVDYTLTLDHKNVATVPGVVVVDTADAGLRIVASTLKKNPICGTDGADCAVTTDATGRSVTTIKPTALPTGTTKITYTAQVPTGTRSCQTLSNTAKVTDPVGERTAPAASLLACDAALGLESWWSTVSAPVGPQSALSVNVANGNTVVQATDSTPVQARGHLAYALRRTYNSSSRPSVTLPGSIGAGWTFNFGEVDDAEGISTAGSALVVPSLATALETVTNPLAITLADRDGTRHSFTPRAATVAIPAASSPAGNGVFAPLTPAGRTLCVDVSYAAPKGVHLGLWRYVTTSSSSCSLTAADSPVVIGFAAVRPDRLRTDYDATGRLLTMTDGNGVALRYLYGALTAGADAGRLTAIYEPRSCPDAPSSPTRDTLPGSCRSFRFDYSNAGPTATSPSVTVFDPADRKTVYELDKALPTSPTDPAAHLVRVVNDDTSTVEYRYGGCGGSADQLCQILDPRKGTTSLSYATAQDVAGSPARTAAITDRRGTRWSFTYPTASQTVAEAANSSTGTAAEKATPGRQQVFSGIDDDGRVALREDYDLVSGERLHKTTFGWDSSACRQPDGKADNNLCAVQRYAAGKSTAGKDSTGTDVPDGSTDERTEFLYTDQGLLLRQRRILTTGTLDSTYGYSTQYVSGSGGTVVAEDKVSGAGGHSFGAGRSNAGTLFAVSDRIQSLTPRGNHPDAGAGWSRFLTSHVVDNNPSAALHTAGADTCAASGNNAPVPQRNTGNLCQSTAPSATGTGPSLIRAVYDAFGQKTRTVTAKAIAETAATAVPPATTYRYFTDGDASSAATSAPLDVSGTVRMGGWLREVTDPAGNYVAFDYDAAGNAVRTWDRDATSGRSAELYPGTLTGPRLDPATGNVPGQFAETRYGTDSAGAPALTRPWRYLRSNSDPLGNRTDHTVDGNGNITTVRPPRGTSAAAAATTEAERIQFDLTRTFDSGDLLLSEATPLQRTASTPTSTRHSYDPFGNRTSTIAADTAGETAGRRASVFRYDAADRTTATLTSRGPAATAGADCAAATVEHAPLLTGQVFCRTTSSYDHVDNLTGSSDGNAVVARMSYDAAHRMLQTRTPRGNNGIVEVRTATVYDPDGRALRSCTPRHFTEGVGSTTGTCEPDAVFAVHATYNDAGLPATTTRYRQVGQPLTSTASYDPDGNPLTGTDPRGTADDGTDVTVRHSFDLLGRRTSTAVPRAGTTRYLYSASGDMIATAAPGGANDNPGGPAARITATRFDAAHRPVDTVQALQVSTLTVPAVQQALATAVTDANAQVNLRSRVLYDADSHVVASYNPRAFTGTDQTGSAALLDAPDERFAARSRFDRDSRPVTQLVPRADSGTVNDLTGDASQRDQCRTGTDPYPAGVHVCRTDLGYDAIGNVTTVRLPTRASDTDTTRQVSYRYTNDNLLEAVLAPNPQTNTGTVTVVASAFDGAGRPVSSTNAAGHTSTSSYTSDGLVASTSGPTGRDGLTHESRTRYNADGQPAVVETPRSIHEPGTGLRTGSETPITVVGYYADGLTRSVTTGRTTGTTPDRFPAVDLTISYDYDKAGNAAAVTSAAANAKEAPNPLGEPVRNSWTADNLLASTTTPVQVTATGVTQSRVSRFGYDPAGRKTSTSVELTGIAAGSGEASRSTQSFGYHPSDRLAHQTGRGGKGSITHAYDATGNPIRVADSTSASTITGSFYLDGLAREVLADGRRTAYAYDGTGAVATRADGPTGGTLTHARFARNHAGLPADIDADGGTSSYGYNLLGQPTTLKRSNGQLQSWEYDPDDLLRSTRVATSTGSELARWEYSYDELARIITQSYSGKSASTVNADPGSGSGPVGTDPDTVLPVAFTSTYDTPGRLSSFTDARGTRTVKFDRNHNRLVYGEGAQPDPSSWSYRADDSIATSTTSDLLGGKTRTFAYDPFGGVVDDGCTRYSYDGFDRLASTAGSGCTSTGVTYGYDGLDRQISRSSGSTTTLTYDGWGSAVTQQDSDAVGSSPLHYTLDAAGQAITAAKADIREFLVNDGTGSIGLAVNTDQTVRCVARYDAYGSPTGNTLLKPTGSCASGSSNNDHFYRGQRRDGTTGNYQLGSRTYDPSKAGFLTPDSYRTGGSAANASVGIDPLTRNTYTYVNGDPLNFKDPSGHRQIAGDDGPGSISSWRLSGSRGSTNSIGEWRDPSSGKIRGERTYYKCGGSNLPCAPSGGGGLTPEAGCLILILACAANAAADAAISGIVGAVGGTIHCDGSALLRCAKNGAKAGLQNTSDTLLPVPGGALGRGAVAVGGKVITGVRGAVRGSTAGSSVVAPGLGSGIGARLRPKTVVSAHVDEAAEAGTGGAGVVRIGQAGENAVRGVYDIGPKATRTIGDNTRIFDGLNSEAVSEVKNVGYQAYTQQLKDSLAYAQGNGLYFDLYVRSGGGSRLSGPLADAIAGNPMFRLKYIP